MEDELSKVRSGGFRGVMKKTPRSEFAGPNLWTAAIGLGLMLVQQARARNRTVRSMLIWEIPV